MNDPDGWAEWDGVRNYQARNMMRDDMKVGDSILFYHSNAKPMAVVGIASVVREGYAARVCPRMRRGPHVGGARQEWRATRLS